MSDDSETLSIIVEYLTRETHQATVCHGLESLAEVLEETSDSGEQEQLHRRLDQVDSRLDDFDKRLTSLENTVEGQNELLSELVDTVEIIQSGTSDSPRLKAARSEDDSVSESETPPHNDWPESIVDDGAMILEEDTSAHYVLHLEIEGRTLEIDVELDEGSLRVKVKP
jgi:predicted nuclease with TOPRIM domain